MYILPYTSTTYHHTLPLLVLFCTDVSKFNALLADPNQSDDDIEKSMTHDGLEPGAWAFEKGQLKPSADLPYDGNLSGDEDGDYN